MPAHSLLETDSARRIDAFPPFGGRTPAKSPAPLPARTLSKSKACILIPQETEAHPLDLSSNSVTFRGAIAEACRGVPLSLTLTVVGLNAGCKPIPNARVEIRHCDKDGYYSGHGASGYLGLRNHVGETFLRGAQLTDSRGQVRFETIYPGWYPGRATHIHFQVFLNSVLSATSQMAFPDAVNRAVYKTPLYALHGQNPVSNATDAIFSDDSNAAYETLSVAPNDRGGYDASLTVGIAEPSQGLIRLEPETGGQFRLEAIHPNPFHAETTIPFRLANPSDVKIDLFSLQGRKILELMHQKMEAGKHSVPLSRRAGGVELHEGSYVYQLTVKNANGLFRQCKLMTVG